MQSSIPMTQMTESDTPTVPDRIARIKSDSKVWIDRQIFTGLAASREVEFDRKIDKLKTTNPLYK